MPLYELVFYDDAGLRTSQDYSRDGEELEATAKRKNTSLEQQGIEEYGHWVVEEVRG